MSLFSKLKAYLTLLILVFMAGCGIFGPNYKNPNTDNPKSFVSRDYLSDYESVNLPMLAWWQGFKDPVLNKLIESALKNNNNIQAAIGNIEAAKGFLQQIEFAWIPTSTMSGAYNSRALAGQGYSFSATPAYTINFVQLIRSYQYAKANYEAVRAAKDAVRLTVISQTATGYFTLLGQDYQLELQNQLVKDLGDLLLLAKIEYQEGLISLYQLQQYEQQYQSALAQIPIIKNNIVASQNALRVLLNENPGLISRGRKFNNINSYGIIPANLPSQVLKNRPDIRQVEEELKAANANIGVAASMFFPSINLTGQGGTAGSSFSQLFTANSDFWIENIAISMPILDFSIYGKIEQAKGQYYTAYYNYIQVVRQAFASVDNDLSAHNQITNSYNDQIKMYQSTITAYQLAESSFSQGLYSKPTLLQNAVTMDNAALVVQASKLQQLGTIVQLYEDLGGGYAYQNFESVNKFHDAHDF